MSLVAAAAVAAAGVGTVAASVASTPATNAAVHTASVAAGAPVAAKHAVGTSTKPAPTKLAAVKAAPAKAAPAAAKAASAKAAPAEHAAAKAAPAKAAAASAKHAPAKAAPAKHTPAKVAPAKAAPARPAPAKHAPAPAKPQPYLIYDSVTPSSIPSHQTVATYANGSYAASASAVAGRAHVLWIDTNGSDTHANVLDVEPGDATPAGAAAWVFTKMRVNHADTAIVYTMISDWQQVKNDVATLPGWMKPHVRYWIADPTGVPHVVPGSNATQWYWGKNYDMTTANPGF